MEISKQLRLAINSAAAKFQDSTISIGETYQYDTVFVQKSAIGSMGSDSEIVTVFEPKKDYWPTQIGIVIGKSHHSNYAHEKGVKILGQTVKEFFSGKKYPEFLIVRRVGSSNWGDDGLQQWDTVTIMPCGFYNKQKA